MSSARQGLSIVGKVVGHHFFGPIGGTVGCSIGGEIGGADLPVDCASNYSQVAELRGDEGYLAKMPVEPA